MYEEQEPTPMQGQGTGAVGTIVIIIIAVFIVGLLLTVALTTAQELGLMNTSLFPISYVVYASIPLIITAIAIKFMVSPPSPPIQY